MIILRVKGGLGNQLFIINYAFFLKSMNKKVFLDTRSGFLRDSYKRKYEIDQVFNGHALVNFNLLIPLSYLVRIFSKKKKSNFLGIKFYEDYYQNKKFYKRSTIKYLKDKISFTVRELNIIKKYNLISNENSVVLHFRLVQFDNLDLNYYKKAIKKIFEKIKSPTFYVFSDDISKVSKIIETLKISNNVILVEDINSSVIEFKLMTLANNFIIANSTFSLWASLLSNLANNSIKIAPKEILTFGDVIPNNYKIY